MQPLDPNYTWIFAITVFFAFLDAYTIGANDVANSFATSVGSRSLKLWHAVTIAIFTEAGGAILLGGSTADTIRNKIINVDLFAKQPELLMQGFMCALIASSSWVMYATYMGWPVSTTHSIVGAIAGFGISAFGPSAVDWSWSGMARIIASWLISPVLSGLIAASIFLLTKHFIMRYSSSDSLQRGINAIPVYFGFALSVMLFYVILRNGRFEIVSVEVDLPTGSYIVKGNWGITMGVLAAILVVICLFGYFFIVPYFKRLLIEEEDLKWYHLFYIFAVPEQPPSDIAKKLREQYTPDQVDVEANTHASSDSDSEDHTPVTLTVGELMDNHPGVAFKQFYTKTQTLLRNSLFMDVATAQGRHAAEMHGLAMKYDNKTEYLFSFLQVCTAAFASFSHGSNDVANSVGPLAGSYAIWTTGKLESKTGVPIWMLIFGAASLDLGLALYGYNIMKSLGNNLTYHSPSRGFTMEFGAALTVITASFLGLPVSTTHCITGATIAVGLCNGALGSVNWRMFTWMLFSWLLTVPFTGTVAGLLFAFTTRSAHFRTDGITTTS
ncbi:Na+/Pi symporter [Nowakowskiella sp. JEL0407]|nr:Na+/Pi symporter [Nowakowskiella sp. JEL0407]